MYSSQLQVLPKWIYSFYRTLFFQIPTKSLLSFPSFQIFLKTHAYTLGPGNQDCKLGENHYFWYLHIIYILIFSVLNLRDGRETVPGNNASIIKSTAYLPCVRKRAPHLQGPFHWILHCKKATNRAESVCADFKKHAQGQPAEPWQCQALSLY